MQLRLHNMLFQHWHNVGHNSHIARRAMSDMANQHKSIIIQLFCAALTKNKSQSFQIKFHKHLSNSWNTLTESHRVTVVHTQMTHIQRCLLVYWCFMVQSRHEKECFHADFTPVWARWVPPGLDKNIKLANDLEAKRTLPLQQGSSHRLRGSLLSDMIQRENSPVRASFSLAWSEVWEGGSECSLPTQL